MRVLDFESIRSMVQSMDPTYFYKWVDDALLYKDEFNMPVKSRINQTDGNYYACMPCIWERTNHAMVKMIGRHALKPGESRPTMMSDLLLYEADTGVLKALMDGEYLTTLRTGATAAHSAILFGKEDFSKVALIGLGNIMTVCAEILFSILQNRKLEVRLYRYHDQEIRFSERFSKYENISFIYCDTYEDTIKESDIVISAVTRTTVNFCDDTCYQKGCTVIPIMTLGFQNCDLFFDHVFTDEIEQIRGFKYFNDFKALNNTSDVLNGKMQGRKDNEERILVYNYGLATTDLYFAIKFYEMSVGGDITYRYCSEKYFA